MRIKEAEEFYYDDYEEYILSNRLGFTNWFNKNYSRYPELSIENLQELVDKVIMWYVFRYPDRQLNDRSIYDGFTNMKDISNEMSFKQLLYRLQRHELLVFDCKYHANDLYYIDNKSYCRINISKNNKDIMGFFITENGNISDKTQVSRGLPFQSIEEFYENNRDSGYDMTHVLRCIQDHKNDLILRNHIIDAIGKGLQYYKHTTAENGNYRMKKFILDVCSNFDDIDLDNKMYIVEQQPLKEEKKSFIKRIIRR